MSADTIATELEDIRMSWNQHSLPALPREIFSACVLLCAALGLSTLAVGQAGELDSTFGKDGLFVALNVGLGNTSGVNNTLGTAIAIQSDGKIVVAGQTELPAGPSPAVFRLCPPAPWTLLSE
jgi:hypothetical protein